MTASSPGDSGAGREMLEPGDATTRAKPPAWWELEAAGPRAGGPKALGLLLREEIGLAFLNCL